MSTSTFSTTSSRVLSTNDEDRGIAVTLHVVTLAAQLLTAGMLHVVVPAVALVLLGGRSDWLRAHVKEQLNFQLSYLGLTLVIGAAFALGFLTLGLGWIVGILLLPVLFVMFIVDLVCSIKAALAASRGELYRFPFAIRIFG